VHKPHLHHQPIFFEKNVKNRSAFTPTKAENPYFAGFFKDFLQMLLSQKIFTRPAIQRIKTPNQGRKPMESRTPIPEDSQNGGKISLLCPEDA